MPNVEQLTPVGQPYQRQPQVELGNVQPYEYTSAQFSQTLPAIWGHRYLTGYYLGEIYDQHLHKWAKCKGKGKGGGKGDSPTEETYYGKWAAALCHGPVSSIGNVYNGEDPIAAPETGVLRLYSRSGQLIKLRDEFDPHISDDGYGLRAFVGNTNRLETARDDFHGRTLYIIDGTQFVHLEDWIKDDIPSWFRRNYGVYSYEFESWEDSETAGEYNETGQYWSVDSEVGPIRIYKGTETQPINPLLEYHPQTERKSGHPNYLGICYYVAGNFQREYRYSFFDNTLIIGGTITPRTSTSGGDGAFAYNKSEAITFGYSTSPPQLKFLIYRETDSLGLAAIPDGTMPPGGEFYASDNDSRILTGKNRTVVDGCLVIAEVFYDVLTNRRYGLGIPAGKLNKQSFIDLARKHRSYDYAVSPIMDKDTTAKSFLMDLLQYDDLVFTKDSSNRLGIARMRDQAKKSRRIEDVHLLRRPEIEFDTWEETWRETRVEYLDRVLNGEKRSVVYFDQSASHNVPFGKYKSFELDGITIQRDAQTMAEDIGAVGAVPETRVSLELDRSQRDIQPGEAIDVKVDGKDRKLIVTEVNEGGSRSPSIKVDGIVDRSYLRDRNNALGGTEDINYGYADLNGSMRFMKIRNRTENDANDYLMVAVSKQEHRVGVALSTSDRYQLEGLARTSLAARIISWRHQASPVGSDSNYAILDITFQSDYENTQFHNIVQTGLSETSTISVVTCLQRVDYWRAHIDNKDNADPNTAYQHTKWHLDEVFIARIRSDPQPRMFDLGEDAQGNLISPEDYTGSEENTRRWMIFVEMGMHGSRSARYVGSSSESGFSTVPCGLCFIGDMPSDPKIHESNATFPGEFNIVPIGEIATRNDVAEGNAPLSNYQRYSYPDRNNLNDYPSNVYPSEWTDSQKPYPTAAVDMPIGQNTFNTREKFHPYPWQERTTIANVTDKDGNTISDLGDSNIVVTEDDPRTGKVWVHALRGVKIDMGGYDFSAGRGESVSYTNSIFKANASGELVDSDGNVIDYENEPGRFEGVVSVREHDGLQDPSPNNVNGRFEPSWNQYLTANLAPYHKLRIAGVDDDSDPPVTTQRVISGHANFEEIKSEEITNPSPGPGEPATIRVNTHFQVEKPNWDIQHVKYNGVLGDTETDNGNPYYQADPNELEERYSNLTDPVNAPAMEATVCSYDNLQSACGYASPCETS